MAIYPTAVGFLAKRFVKIMVNNEFKEHLKLMPEWVKLDCDRQELIIKKLKCSGSSRRNYTASLNKSEQDLWLFEKGAYAMFEHLKKEGLLK